MTLTTLPRSKLTDTIAGTITGSGTRMLLIHGVGMNADYWGNLLEPLSPHFELTVIDMPGHGESSPCVIQSPSLQHYTDSIASMIRTPTIVAGHSMGALIALDLAVRYQNNISGIAVLNGIYRRSEAAIKAVKSRVTELEENPKTDPQDTLNRWFGERPQGELAQASTQCRQWLQAIEPTQYINAYRAFAHADAPDDQAIAGIRCPALFMTGELEPNSTPAMSQAMCALVSGALCHIVKDAKHMMSMTHGEQVTNALIQYFGAAENA